MVAATLVASTALTSVALGADVTGTQKVSVIGGAATLPASVKMVELSKTNVVPYLLNDFEQYAKNRSNKNMPSKAVEKSSSLGVNHDNEDKLADYMATQTILSWLDSYRLGERTDMYQWQVKDADGRKTAQVLAVKFKGAFAMAPGVPFQMNGNYPKIDEPTVDAGIFMLNMQLNELRKKGAPIVLKTGTLGDSTVEAKVDYSVRVDNLMPIDKLMGSRYPTYTTSANVLYSVGGFEQAYYVQPAVVLTKSEPILYLMITSDIEKSTFAPIFNGFVSSLK